MLLSSGNVIETTEADIKPLGRVLKEYISKKFTGCISYRNVIQGVYISILIINGAIASCRAIDRGSVYEGTACADTAMRYLYQPEGIVEVVEVPSEIMLIDLIVFPLARLEESTAMTTSLGAEPLSIPAPTPTTAAEPLEAEKPPTPTIPLREETIPIPQTTPSAPPIEAEKVVAAKPAEIETTLMSQPTQPPPLLGQISIINECIDPMTLYRIMRSSQIVETVTKLLSVDEIIDKVKKLGQEKRYKYIYVTGIIDENTFRLIYDVETNNVFIELEKGATQICGSNALDFLKEKSVSSVRIWSI